MADYFSKFPYMFPVASTHHFKTITHLRELFAAEGVPTIIMSDNRPPFNGEEFRQFSCGFDFVHTTSSPHFHQSNGFIEAMVKKVKNAYKKTDRSPMLRPEHYFSYVTHLSWQTSHPQQRFYMVNQHKVQSFQDHPRGSICVRSNKDWLNCKRNKKNSLTEPTEPRDLHPLKVKEQVQFFQNKQATGPIKWMTGTVVEILECG